MFFSPILWLYTNGTCISLPNTSLALKSHPPKVYICALCSQYTYVYMHVGSDITNESLISFVPQL